MFRIDAVLYGYTRVVGHFSGRDARLAAGFRLPFRAIEELWYRRVQQVFDSEGGEGASGSWAPLSEAYAAWKAVHYPGQPILQARGDMLRSLLGGQDSVRRIEPYQMDLGTSLKSDEGEVLAALHQYGGGGRPARPPLSMGPQFIEASLQVVGDYVAGTP